MSTDQFRIEIVRILRGEIAGVRNDLMRLESKVDELNKWRWTVMGYATGAAAAVGFLAAYVVKVI